MNVVNTMSMTPMLYLLEAEHGGSKNSVRVGMSTEGFSHAHETDERNDKTALAE